MSRIAFLGIGAMGGRMARRLIAAGHALQVWNRTPEAAAPLQAAGARLAESPRACAREAEIVFSMLTDDAASRSVWLDEGIGAMAGVSPGALVVECGTVTPAWISAFGAAAQAARALPVDAPVAGSRPQAEAGKLIFFLGGAPAARAALRPTLSSMAGAVHEIGDLGQGARMKLAVNALFAGQVALAAELSAFLAAGGLPAGSATDILAALPVTSPAMAAALSGMASGAFAPQFPIDLMEKDLRYIAETARAQGGVTPVSVAVGERFAAAQAAGHGAENITAIARLYS